MEPIYIPFLKKLLKQGGVQFLSLATAIITHTVILHVFHKHTRPKHSLQTRGTTLIFVPSASLPPALQPAIIIFVSSVVQSTVNI